MSTQNFVIKSKCDGSGCGCDLKSLAFKKRLRKEMEKEADMT